MKNNLNVLTTLNLSPQAQTRIREVSERIKLTVIAADKPEKIPDEHWAEAEVLYTSTVLPDLEKVPNLKWVQFNSAGVDSVVEHPVVQDEAITATTMSGVITGQVAETVLMAILAFGRRLFKLRRFQHEHKWPGREEKRKALLPVDLRGRSVGILGYGSIGRQVARLLRPFGARVLAVKRDVMNPEDSGYTRQGMGDPHGDLFHRLYPMEALHSLLGESDFVVVALPLTEATYHLINADALAAMKDSAYLINVGRGGLVDEQALIQALRSKRLAGAALDVFETEPLPEDSPLWDMKQVLISPHISGLSRYLEDDTLSLFIENLNRYLEGLPLHNSVNPHRGY